MNFGQALELLKSGRKVAREGWNGKGMFIVHSSGVSDFRDYCDLEHFLAIKNVKGTYNTWVPSISDLFAEDWEVIK
jgi:hypothetical protein